MHIANKRIFKNSIIMFLRMFFVMAVSLYSVRIALNTLGVVDYGIYDVVAGFITMLSFFSSSLQNATLRFYSHAIGERNLINQNKVFNISLIIYIGIVIIVLLFAETWGLWFLKNKMTIPPERFSSAIWVYQFALLSFIVTIISIPFTSLIIAHENMGFYALVSIIDCVLKLLILFLLLFLPFDRLKMYSILILAVTIFKELLNITYCKIKYEECFFRFQWDKKLFSSIFSFSGWTLFGSLANIANNQGNNILINIFFGPIMNAARAIAFQISNAVLVFSNNFFVVIRPPLIKSYAEKDYKYTMNLFYFSSKITYILLLIIFIPLYFETEFVLSLWLKEFNLHMILFTRLMLISSVILAMHMPITTLMQANGNIRKYHLIVESITLLSLPLTYLFYKMGYSVESTFVISIIVFALAHMIRLIVLKKVVGISLKEYTYKFLRPIAIITFFSISIAYIIHTYFSYGTTRFILLIFTVCIGTLFISFIVSFNTTERKELISIVKKRF